MGYLYILHHLLEGAAAFMDFIIYILELSPHGYTTG